MRMPFHSTLKWPLIIALSCAAMPQHAAAGSSKWEETEGARIRIVAERAEPGQDHLRGLLQIELEPGWKTYWREPGSAGIPPMVSVGDQTVSDVTIHYPAPEWTDDSYGSWAGYKHPVSLPLTFSFEAGETPGQIDADVFVGICRDVCVPVSAQFTVPVDEKRTNAMQALLLDTAFSALPDGNTDRLSVERATWTADGALEITVAHSSTAHSTPDLFVSAGSDHPFKKPVPVVASETETVFHIEPSFDPSKTGVLELIVTARNGIEAVEITIEVPAPSAT